MNRNGYFGIAPKNITLNNQVAPQQIPPKNACFSFSLQFLVEMESKLTRSAVSVATKMCKRSRYNFTRSFVVLTVYHGIQMPFVVVQYIDSSSSNMSHSRSKRAGSESTVGNERGVWLDRRTDLRFRRHARRLSYR